MRTKVSAVIVNFNESRFLRECITRLSFCDEVLLIDLGSVDNSVEIAQSLGARVLFHEWVPFGEKVRNFAIENANNDWILFADPDLYYPLGIGQKIDCLISNESSHIGIIHMAVRRYFNNSPVYYGSKGEIQSYVAVINRKKTLIQPFLHHSGIIPVDNASVVGLLVNASEYIEHYWGESLKDIKQKAYRYFPYEGERRHHLYHKFSLFRFVKELVKSFIKEMQLKAYKDRYSLVLMFFTLWYIIQANIHWFFYEVRLRKQG